MQSAFFSTEKKKSRLAKLAVPWNLYDCHTLRFWTRRPASNTLYYMMALVDDHDVRRPWEELVIFIKPPKHPIGVGHTFPFYIAFSSWVSRKHWDLTWYQFRSNGMITVMFVSLKFKTLNLSTKYYVSEKILFRENNYERWQIWCPLFGEVSMLTLSPILWHCPCWHWPTVSLLKDFLKPLNEKVLLGVS